MQYFVNYLVILAWAIVVSIIMAVSYGMAIWVLDKMLIEIRSLRNVTKKPIALAIVLGSFILGVALIISSLCK